MQSPSGLDDDKFQVARAAKLSRDNLIALQREIVNDRQALELQVNSLVCSEEVEAAYRLKGKQLYWIGTQLGKIRDAQRAANRKANDKGKQKRRASFYEAFFFVCRRELERLDFKELCEEAKQRSGEDPPNHDVPPAPRGVIHGGDADRA